MGKYILWDCNEEDGCGRLEEGDVWVVTSTFCRRLVLWILSPSV